MRRLLTELKLLLLKLFILLMLPILAIECYALTTVGSVQVQESIIWGYYSYREDYAKPLPMPVQLILKRSDQYTQVGQLSYINYEVNNLLTYTDDKTAYGDVNQLWWFNPGEYFATPAESVAILKGDCDDYAIIKYRMAQQLGYRTAVAVVNVDHDMDKMHAVTFVVLPDARVYVLDLNLNGALELQDWLRATRADVFLMLDRHGPHLPNNWLAGTHEKLPAPAPIELPPTVVLPAPAPVS